MADQVPDWAKDSAVPDWAKDSSTPDWAGGAAPAPAPKPPTKAPAGEKSFGERGMDILGATEMRAAKIGRAHV